MRQGRVEGKVAIVTGAAGTIGRACARRLTDEGALVVAADIDEAGLGSVVASIEAAGGTAVGVTVDVASESDIASMVSVAMEEFGRLDILHNNAALVSARQTQLDQTVLDMTVELWDETLAVDLRGPMLACKHAIPVMIENGGGSIIHTSSGAALRGNHRLTAYGAAKAALINLSRYVATQYGKQGVRSNVVVPGVIVKPKFSQEFIKASLKRAMTPHLGDGDDVAHCVVYLASNESRFVTGQSICIDGGANSH